MTNRPIEGQAQSWTNNQKAFCLLMLILGFTYGSTAVAILSISDPHVMYLASATLMFGLGLVFKNLGALFGIFPRKPSLGGGVMCFLAATSLLRAIDIDPLLGALLSSLVPAAFTLHFFITYKPE